VIARSTLLAFVANRVDPRDRDVVYEQLDAWYRITLASHWKNPAELKLLFGAASIVSSTWVVFNIKGNHYRMVVSINYGNQIVTVVWLGTHQEYDRINVKEVTYDRTRYFSPRDRD
jgi:mRNA interferase HigB